MPPSTEPASTEGAVQLQKEKLRHDWLKLEYEELNRYGRTVYETIFRLAQMTFVINPALGGGFYYVFIEKRPALFGEIGAVGIAIAILGVVYNVGAYGVYVQSHSFLEALLIRIRELDDQAGSRTHVALEETAPYSYVRYWGQRAESRSDSADLFTRLFLLVLFVCWALVLGYAAYTLFLPHDRPYLLVLETTVLAVSVPILFFLLKKGKGSSTSPRSK